MAIKAVVFDCLGVLYGEYTRTYNQPLIAIAKKLKANYKTAVLSNMSGMGLRTHLDQGKMADAFHVVVASGDTDYIKPQREIFEHVAQLLGVELGEILFFDDSFEHVHSARQYGMHAVRYRSIDDVTEALATHHLNYL